MISHRRNEHHTSARELAGAVRDGDRMTGACAGRARAEPGAGADPGVGRTSVDNEVEGLAANLDRGDVGVERVGHRAGAGSGRAVAAEVLLEEVLGRLDVAHFLDGNGHEGLALDRSGEGRKNEGGDERGGESDADHSEQRMRQVSNGELEVCDKE
jgi:hypothetical protein